MWMFRVELCLRLECLTSMLIAYKKVLLLVVVAHCFTKVAHAQSHVVAHRLHEVVHMLHTAHECTGHDAAEDCTKVASCTRDVTWGFTRGCTEVTRGLSKVAPRVAQCTVHKCTRLHMRFTGLHTVKLFPRVCPIDKTMIASLPNDHICADRLCCTIVRY